MSEEITFKLRKEDMWKYSTFVLLAVVVVWGIVALTGDNTPNQQTVVQGNTEAPTVSIDFAKVIESNTPSIGSVDAPVTILEFADFSCPFCAAASGDNPTYTAYMQQRQPGWEPPVSNVIKDYVKSGKVRLVTFYTMGHSGGRPAQVTAWCLNDQKSDFYWQFYTKAYANLDDTEDAAKMKALANTISGIDAKKLDSCVSSGKYDSRFDEEQSKGAILGISGTPGFIIGKTSGDGAASLVRGAYPYSTFQELIEAKL